MSRRSHIEGQSFPFQLPPETWQLIFEHATGVADEVDTCKTPSLFSIWDSQYMPFVDHRAAYRRAMTLALVCRDWYELVGYLLYRHIVVDGIDSIDRIRILLLSPATVMVRKLPILHPNRRSRRFWPQVLTLRFPSVISSDLPSPSSSRMLSGLTSLFEIAPNIRHFRFENGENFLLYIIAMEIFDTLPQRVSLVELQNVWITGSCIPTTLRERLVGLRVSLDSSLKYFTSTLNFPTLRFLSIDVEGDILAPNWELPSLAVLQIRFRAFSTNFNDSMVEKLLCAAGHNLLRLDVSGKSKISLTGFMKALHPCRQLQILSIEPGTLKQDGSTCGDTKLPSIAKLVWLSSGAQDCIINSMRVVIVALPRLREVTIMLPAEGTTPDPISFKDDLITAMKQSNSSLHVSLCMV